MQDAALARMGQQMSDAVASLTPGAMLRAWLPFSPSPPAQMQDAMSNLFKAPFAAREPENA